MAEETGSARQEAERLVATVLAMAARSGPGDAGRGDDSLAGTGARIVEGLGTLGNTVAEMVGQLAGTAGEGSARPAREHSGRPAGERSGDAADVTSEARGAGDAAASRGADGAAGARGGGDAGSHGPGDAAGSRGGWGAADDSRAGDQHGDGWDLRTMWSAAARSPVTDGWATGSAECCVCPVCRTIATLRNPTPGAAERLATGAGDFATGVASLMRAVSAMSGSRPRPARTSRPAPPPPDPDQAWSAATRTAEGPDLTPGEDEAPWAAATRAAAREQEQAARERREAARRAQEAARRAQEAARRVQEAARLARQGAGGEQETGRDHDGAAGGAGGVAAAGEGQGARPGAPASGPGPRTGQDVWAAATADRGDVGVPPTPDVDHDEAGGAAPTEK